MHNILIKFDLLIYLFRIFHNETTHKRIILFDNLFFFSTFQKSNVVSLF